MMKMLAVLIGGVLAGAFAASRWPRETEAVIDAAERTGVDQALMNVAAIEVPAAAVVLGRLVLANEKGRIS